MATVGESAPAYIMVPDVDADVRPIAAYDAVIVDVDVAIGNVIVATGLAVPADVDTDHPAVERVTEMRV